MEAKYPPAKYRNRDTHEVVTAITFDELVEHGRREVAEKRRQHAVLTLGVSYPVTGMPWSFHYMGNPVTIESNDCYLVPMIEKTGGISTGSYKFCRGQILVAFPNRGAVPEARLIPYTPEMFPLNFEPLTPHQAVAHEVDKSLMESAAQSFQKAHEETISGIVKWVTEAAITHKLTGEQTIRAAVEAGYTAAKNGVPKITIPK